LKRAALLALGTTLGACSLTPPACAPVDVGDLKVQFGFGGVPQVPATINGRRFAMLFDTGAAASIITPETQAALNLPAARITTAAGSGTSIGTVRLHGAGGDVDARVVTAHNFTLGNTEDDDATFVVAAMGAPAMHLGGVIGNDILLNFAIALDLPDNRIALIAAPGCETLLPPWKGAYAAVPFTYDPQTASPRFPIHINGKTLTGMIDTGSGTTVVAEETLARAGIEPAAVLADVRVRGLGVGNRQVALKAERFETLSIGGDIFTSPVLAVLPGARIGGADVIIGENFLRTGRVFIANSTRTLYIEVPSRGGR
jgi:predicted aspartyl protease